MPKLSMKKAAKIGKPATKKPAQKKDADISRRELKEAIDDLVLAVQQLNSDLAKIYDMEDVPPFIPDDEIPY